MMKKLPKNAIMFALLLFALNSVAQITNNTTLPGKDLIYYQDTKSTVTNSVATPKLPNSGLTIWRETSSGGGFGNQTSIPAVGTAAGQLGYTRPANVYPEGPVAAEQSYRVHSHQGGNQNHKIWFNVESVDLSAYDGSTKFFTFSAWSRFYNDGTASRIDTQNKIYYTTNFTTGTNPTTGVTWTEISKANLINVSSSDEFGANGVWTTHTIDLSEITCGNKFAIAIVRETSSDGPNPGTTTFGSTNQNGMFYVSGLVYTGSNSYVTPGDLIASNSVSTGTTVTTPSITSATGQTGIFDTPTAATGNNNTNFVNTGGSKWQALLGTSDITPSITPRLKVQSIPAGEGYKFTVSNTYNPIAISKITYKMYNGRQNSSADNEASEWIVQASNDDTTWDDISEAFKMFSANSSPNIGTQLLTTTKPYRHYRLVLNEAWKPKLGSEANGTRLEDINFTVASVWNGTTNDITSIANYNTDRQPNNSEIIIPVTTSENYPTIATGTTVTNNLILESGVSLVTEGTGTVTGTVNYKRKITQDNTNNTTGWYLVSTPITGQDYNDDYFSDNKISSGTGSNRAVATYNNGVTPNTWSYAQAGATASFEKAKGYSIKTFVCHNVSFKGTLNTGTTETVTISHGGGTGSGFNLVGNPYASYINSQTLLDLAGNTNILEEKTIWVWNSSNKTYEAKISSVPFMVAPGQGFFVESKVAGGTLTFEKTNQSHNTTDTFRKTKPNASIQLNITNGTLFRSAQILYSDKATKGFDNGYDGKSFTGVSNSFDVFTQLLAEDSGKNYQVQSLPNTDLESMVVPVGLLASNGQEITFTAEALNLQNEIKVFLEDRNTGTFTRLDDGGLYKIITKEDLKGAGRFYLHTTQSVLNTNNEILQNVSIYESNANTLNIVGLMDGKISLQLFNTLGKQVLNTKFDASGFNSVNLPKLSKGVYIVKVSSNNGNISKKIILK